MPPVAYALTSDTLIGVVRAWTIARHKETREALGEDEATPLAVLGGLLLWVLRLAMAPRSTLRGFRAWVITECPAAPSRRARHPASRPAARATGRLTFPMIGRDEGPKVNVTNADIDAAFAAEDVDRYGQ